MIPCNKDLLHYDEVLLANFLPHATANNRRSGSGNSKDIELQTICKSWQSLFDRTKMRIFTPGHRYDLFVETIKI